MRRIGASEARAEWGALLDRVAKGEEVVITRRDKPVARIIPEGPRRLEEVRRAVNGLRALQRRIRGRRKARLSDRELRAAIDEGRR